MEVIKMKTVTYEFNMVGNEKMIVTLKDDIVIGVEYSEEGFTIPSTVKKCWWTIPQAEWKECEHIIVVEDSQYWCRLCNKPFTVEEYKEFAGPIPMCIKCGSRMYQSGKHAMICWTDGCNYAIKHETGTSYPKTPKRCVSETSCHWIRSKVADLNDKLDTKLSGISIKDTLTRGLEVAEKKEDK